MEILTPFLSAFATWFFTHIYHRREKKNDLETKLTARIEELTMMLIKTNTKLLENVKAINKLQLENEHLKNQINLIKLKNCN